MFFSKTTFLISCSLPNFCNALKVDSSQNQIEHLKLLAQKIDSLTSNIDKARCYLEVIKLKNLCKEKAKNELQTKKLKRSIILQKHLKN